MITWLDYVVIAIYFGVMIVCGYWGMRQTKNADDFWVAGRRLGLFMYLGTMVAVAMGGASSVGSTRLGYKFGLSGMWMVGIFGIGIMALGVLLATRLSRLRLYSVSEMLERRYEKYSRLISAIIMAIYTSSIAVIQVVAMGTIIHSLLGWNEIMSMVVAGGIILAYTVAGGMWSVTLTDIFQFVLMTVAIFFILLPTALFKVGGFGKLTAVLPASYFDMTAIGWDTIFAYFLLFFFGLLVGQDLWQRLFTAKNDKVARIGTIGAGVFAIALAIATVIIGMAAKVLLPNLENADFAFAQITTLILPAGLSGLVLAGALAALMSTADSGILASATLLTNDIYGRFLKPDASETHLFSIARWVTLANSLVVLGMAIWIQDVIGALSLAYAFLTGSLFVPIIGAIFWKRATWQGAVISMVISAIVVIQQILQKGVLSTDPILYSLPVSLIVFVVASLLSPAPDEAKLREWEECFEQIDSTLSQ